MVSTVHLLRHGEVANPDGVVYADLPGFGLSESGREQAAAAARRLSTVDPVAIVSSPLLRAVETADAVAQTTGREVVTDPRLTEWGLARRWAGVQWDRLSDRFPGELEAYLSDPEQISFGPETLAELTARMRRVVDDLGARHPHGVVVAVSHQDPIQAARLSLTGRPLADLPRDKPGHAEIVSLRRLGDGWTEVGRWAPDAASTPFPPAT